jgi:hypothetical protein
MRIISSLILFLLLLGTAAHSQTQPEDLPLGIIDTINNLKDSTYKNRLEKEAEIANRVRREKYQEQMMLGKQSQIFANLRAVFQRTKDYLKRGVDTSGIEKELAETEKKIDLAGDGIFINQGTIQTARNISTSAILLDELAGRNQVREKQIRTYLIELEEFRNTIDSLTYPQIRLR